MSRTTPTGIPIIACSECHADHPKNRTHCNNCGRTSAFINEAGKCLTCNGEPNER